jgi:hypothetical protein
MNIISRPARGGKTVTLIKLSAETQFPIVCTNHNQKENVLRTANYMKQKIPEPIVFDKDCARSITSNAVLVDNADELLAKIIGKPVMTATIKGGSYIQGLKKEPDRAGFEREYYGVWECDQNTIDDLNNISSDLPNDELSQKCFEQFKKLGDKEQRL